MNSELLDTPSLALTPQSLSAYPLPDVALGCDKEDRGHILVIAGCREIPGAALLAATAALRAGAGKLTIATASSIAPGIALAVPESRTIALNENVDGAIAALDNKGVEALSCLHGKVDAVLVGPGMQNEAACGAIARRLGKIFPTTPLILDAFAMCAVQERSFSGTPMVTPHAGEMAHLTGIAKEAILADPIDAALQAANSWNAIVVLKGAKTVIATPDGKSWLHAEDNAGLATSGSGDVLAGILGGLAARQLPLLNAALWGVTLHAQAGARLSARHGPIGYLARDISAEIPDILRDLNEP
jgi:ADP-dependent NAD(P)H-hydrate dehydratase